MRETVYLAGPMTGLPDFNYPKFHEVAAAWRAEGWEVLNPAEPPDGDTTKPREYYLRISIKMIVEEADAVMVLSGWECAPGARLEVAIARELGLPIYDAEIFGDYYETALDEAKRLVHGVRGGSYGHPLDDYTRTAAIWSAILGHDITAEQAILCMCAVKISREVNKAKRDNRVDLAGYAECLEMCYVERERRVAATP